jgi:hypothetical protein
MIKTVIKSPATKKVAKEILIDIVVEFMFKLIKHIMESKKKK